MLGFPNIMEVLEPKNLPLFPLEPFAITIATMTIAAITNPVIIFLPFFLNRTIFYL